MSLHHEPPQTLARSDADGFDIALRRHDTDHGPVHELVVNGMFAMDDVDNSSELALADLADPDAARVLVGGLGLGFTAERVLQRCPRAMVDVVDLSASLIGWARQSLTPTLGRLSTSDRVHFTAADIADVLRGSTPSATSLGTTSPNASAPGGPWDAVLLDVDNGPDFLIHDHNAQLYDADLLTAAFHQVVPGGVLAIWSERVSPALAARLAELDADHGTVVVPVDREGHHVDYAIHWVRRSGSPSASTTDLMTS